MNSPQSTGLHAFFRAAFLQLSPNIRDLKWQWRVTLLLFPFVSRMRAWGADDLAGCSVRLRPDLKHGSTARYW